MRRSRAAMAVLVASIAMLVTPVARAGSSRDARVTLLGPYQGRHSVTELEWNLIWTNLQWIRSFEEGSYFRSAIVFYQPDSVRFRTAVAVLENRRYADPEPFSKLHDYQQKAAMQGAIDLLLVLMTASFPVVKDHPELVVVEFWYYGQVGTTHSLLAKFEEGRITMER